MNWYLKRMGKKEHYAVNWFSRMWWHWICDRISHFMKGLFHFLNRIYFCYIYPFIPTNRHRDKHALFRLSPANAWLFKHKLLFVIFIYFKILTFFHSKQLHSKLITPIKVMAKMFTIIIECLKVKHVQGLRLSLIKQ